MKKLVLIVMYVVMLVFVSACSDETSNDKSEGTVEVTILGTIKSEVGEQFEEALEVYNASQSKYKVSVIPMDGQNPYEKMTSLYASNNAPTIMIMGQEMEEFKDKLLDLSDTEFSSKAFAGTQENATFNGKVVGMPVTVEGFGLLYNQEVLNAAIDGEFDPKTIKNIQDLEELFEKIEDLEGKKAIHLSPMDWSLGAHLSNIMFSTQSENHEERVAFMNDLKNGSADLLNNDVFHKWLKVFDLLKKYNINSESPLSPDYDAGTVALANGDVGFWFMGNWAYSPLVEINPEGTFGIMPLPISEENDEYGNKELSVGVPMYIVVDGDQSTKEEQEGAIDFLNWLVTKPEGQSYYVNKMNFIPVFKGVEHQPNDFMSETIMNYTEQGNTLEWMNMLYPADGWPSMGASMQKYLDGVIGKDELAKEFEAYWAQQE